MIKHYPKYIKSIDDTDNLFEYFKKKLKWEELTFGKYKLKRQACRLSLYDISKDKIITKLMNYIEIIFNVKCSSIFCNYYKNGLNYTPYHQDTYYNISHVITLSLGCSREFCLKDIKTKKVTKYLLNDGDIFIFDEIANKKYKHSVPIRKKIKDGRISIVFFCVGKEYI